MSLLVAAMLAAMMSTMDSSMLSLSSMVTLDVVKGIWPTLSEHGQLITGKLVGLVLVMGSVTMTSLLQFNLASLLTIQANLLLQVAPTFMFGVLNRTLTSPMGGDYVFPPPPL